MSEHTKGPWSYNGFVYCDNGGKARQIIGADGNEVVGEFGLDEEDAVRIVACVNACDGISTFNLELWRDQDALGPNWLECIQLLMKQRGQLLAALKAGMFMFEHAKDSTDAGAKRYSDAAAAIAAVEQPAPAPTSTLDQLNEIAKLRGYSPDWAAKVLAARGAHVAPAADGWIEWNGGVCVDVKFDDGRIYADDLACNWRWTKKIVAYRVVQGGAA